jgi:hypothetical protein
VPNPMTISIFEIVGSPLCVAVADGQRVFDQISQAMSNGHPVTLTFKNVQTLTSAFLNAAIGQLYSRYSDDQIKALLNVEDLDKDDDNLLRRVVDTAKEYFKDPTKFRDSEKGVLGDVDE